MGAMKALTLHQPWASLVAVGAKTIETRSWSTSYRGPLAIHAARRPMGDAEHSLWWECIAALKGVSDRAGVWAMSDHPSHPLPLGCVVATCELVDILPIVKEGDFTTGVEPVIAQRAMWATGLTLLKWPGNEGDPQVGNDITDQLPYGDFTPGRYAWMLDNVALLERPAPATGRQRLWEWPA